MANFVDPSDQSLWPKLDVGPGHISAQERSKETESSEAFQPVSFDSDSLSFVDSHLQDRVYVDNDRRLQRMRKYSIHEQHQQNRQNNHHVYASTTHSNVTHQGKNAVWNTAPRKRKENISYYEKIRQSVERKNVTPSNVEGQVISSWHDIVKADTSTVAKYASFKPNNVQQTKELKEDKNMAVIKCVTGKKAYRRSSEFHLRNKEEGYDVIANGGAPLTSGSKALNAVRLMDAAACDKAGRSKTHSHLTHRGKSSAWNTQKPKFEDSRRTRRGRNPIPARIKQQFDLLSRSKTIFDK